MIRRGSLATGRWMALMLSGTITLGGLTAGCGGGEKDAGDENYTQKFEKPATEAPPPKEKPIPYKDLSPREKKALDKG